MENIEGYLTQRFVYHYTSFDTLMKILGDIQDEMFTMHASSAFTMNDPREFIHGYEKMIAILPKIEEKLNINDERYKLSNYWDCYWGSSPNGWYDFHVDLMKKYALIPFVVSFSRQRDFLPLWSMYGNDGMGVAIKIDLENDSIKKWGDDKFDSLMNLIRVVDVVYNDIPSHHFVAHRMTEEYQQYIQEVEGITGNKELEKIQYDAIFQMMLAASPYIKDGAYQYEKESRTSKLSLEYDEIKFKKGLKDSQIPYVEYPFPIECLTEIIIGPCADYESAKQCLAIKMGQKRIKNVEISKSKVPYRN